MWQLFFESSMGTKEAEMTRVISFLAGRKSVDKEEKSFPTSVLRPRLISAPNAITEIASAIQDNM